MERVSYLTEEQADISNSVKFIRKQITALQEQCNRLQVERHYLMCKRAEVQKMHMKKLNKPKDAMDNSSVETTELPPVQIETNPEAVNQRVIDLSVAENLNSVFEDFEAESEEDDEDMET